MVERQDHAIDQPAALALQQHLNGVFRGEPDKGLKVPGHRLGLKGPQIIVFQPSHECCNSAAFNPWGVLQNAINKLLGRPHGRAAPIPAN